MLDTNVLTAITVAVAPTLAVIASWWNTAAAARAAAAQAEVARQDNAKTAAATAAAADVKLTQIHTSVNSNHAEDIKRLDASIAEVAALKEQMILMKNFADKLATTAPVVTLPVAAEVVVTPAPPKTRRSRKTR